jgi:AcrR family transcriptional regulator
VLLYLFGSKEQLVRALLARAREHELELLEDVLHAPGPHTLHALAIELWRWLAAPEQRALLTLWVEAYARSLVDPSGPWTQFARRTVEDWLELLARSQPPAVRETPAGARERTAVLALLRGALLDLLATGEGERVGDAVRATLSQTEARRPARG